MNRRQLLKTSLLGAAALPAFASPQSTLQMLSSCGCAPMAAAALALPSAPRLKVTDMKVFGVSPASVPRDRPYVFVKIETDAGVVGWGEATLEGKAESAMQAVRDMSYAIIGQDPMQVEHHWQSMYIHGFYRAGPVLGSAISGIDQALWDIRGKVLGKPVYELLGGPVDERGVRGYYHLLSGSIRERMPANATFREQLRFIRQLAEQYGVTAFKTGVPDFYEFLDTHERIKEAVDHLFILREEMGDKIDIAIDFHAKAGPTVAAMICKEVESLNLMFMEEVCPPENVKAMKRVSDRTTVPIATGERLITHYGCREIIEQKVADILQPDVNHVGGISALWKVAAMAEASGIQMAPHACEGPVGAIASMHVDAAMPNFLVQEICSSVEPEEKEKMWEEWMGFPAMRMVDGYYPLNDKPGLGFELNEEDFKKYPFQGTKPFMLLPTNDDGSIASP
ncbi:MAG: galactonate dehydratase [Acidobacteria bacterium]|nr:galactonate dehydratase [Acidobacteriota bacterium]MDA1234336.1 galactonate dehydratase [Acidobacteriota bacterium]